MVASVSSAIIRSFHNLDSSNSDPYLTTFTCAEFGDFGRVGDSLHRGHRAWRVRGCMRKGEMCDKHFHADDHVKFGVVLQRDCHFICPVTQLPMNGKYK